MGTNILRTKKVLMDVDTGIDDAVAIMVALQSPEIEIIGITSVTGNVTARAAALAASSWRRRSSSRTMCIR